jgi:hypothetical protein
VGRNEGVVVGCAVGACEGDGGGANIAAAALAAATDTISAAAISALSFCHFPSRVCKQLKQWLTTKSSIVFGVSVFEFAEVPVVSMCSPTLGWHTRAFIVERCATQTVLSVDIFFAVQYFILALGLHMAGAGVGGRVFWNISFSSCACRALIHFVVSRKVES